MTAEYDTLIRIRALFRTFPDCIVNLNMRCIVIGFGKTYSGTTTGSFILVVILLETYFLSSKILCIPMDPGHTASMIRDMAIVIYFGNDRFSWHCVCDKGETTGGKSRFVQLLYFSFCIGSFCS